MNIASPVGAVDYATGYEVSVSVFYLAPIGLAAWYGGRKTGIAFSLTCCACWYFADFSVGHRYSNPVIPFWNAFVRLGFFLIVAPLLAVADELMYRVTRRGKGAVEFSVVGRTA